MILVSLRYYATGSVKNLGGDVMDICQQSASRIVTRISFLLAKKMKDFVHFPSTSEGITLIKQKFHEIAEFPDVVGCLDCTHIKIKSPGRNYAEAYKNRKGSTQDNFIFNSSSLKKSLYCGEMEGILLGDSDYAVSPILMTPILSPINAAQVRYNRSHAKTRSVVNKAFGIWKKRFKCLQIGMGIKLETAVAVICACATLHNLAIISKDTMEPFLHYEEEEQETVQVESENIHSSGFAARDALVHKFFQ
ncbi:unnamed protein product, partial [Iphiclides podalirius]